MKNKLIIILLSLILTSLGIIVLLYFLALDKNENVFVRNVSEIENFNPQMTDPNSISASVEKQLHILGYENVHVVISYDEFGKYSVQGSATKPVTVLKLKLPHDSLYYMSK